MYGWCRCCRSSWCNDWGNTVIGAGSIVTKDIPANVVAVGNPCKVIREISQRDFEYYNGDLKIDIE